MHSSKISFKFRKVPDKAQKQGEEKEMLAPQKQKEILSNEEIIGILEDLEKKEERRLAKITKSACAESFSEKMVRKISLLEQLRKKAEENKKISAICIEYANECLFVRKKEISWVSLWILGNDEEEISEKEISENLTDSQSQLNLLLDALLENRAEIYIIWKK